MAYFYLITSHIRFGLLHLFHYTPEQQRTIGIQPVVF